MARIVLVADDSPTIQKKALGILKGEGFEVETVSNGVAAIKRLAVLRPSVVLADVSMPGRDGYEVCEFVKKSQDHAHVPVLLVASDMEPYDDARGAQVRADGIIKKPFEPQDLIDIVTRFADQFDAETSAAAAPPVPPPMKREPTQELPAITEEQESAPTVVQTPDFAAQPEGMAFAEPGMEEPPASFLSPSPAAMEPPAYSEAPSDPGFAFDQAPQPEFAVPAEPEYAEPHAGVEPQSVEPVHPTAHQFGESSYPAPEPAYVEPPPADEPTYAEAPAATEATYAQPYQAVEPEYSKAADTPASARAEASQPAEYQSVEPPPAFEAGAESPHYHGEELKEESATAGSALPSPYVPSFYDEPHAAAPEPVFIEEEVAHPPHVASDDSEVRTMIFRAPVELAEPVWTDDTLPALPPEPVSPHVHAGAPESSAAETVESAPPPPAHPDYAAEPAGQPEPPVASSETMAEPLLESPSSASSVTATNLDSFTLDDAAAGQVHFPSHAVESPAPDAPPVHEETVEAASMEPEPTNFVSAQEPAEAVRMEDVPPEPSPSAPAPQYAAEEFYPATPAQEPPASELAYIEKPEQDMVPLESPAEAPQEIAPETAGPPDQTEAASAAPAAEAAAPMSEYDWSLIYSVVHRVVVKMSPPALPMEAVEDLAKRLAEEVATEIAAEANQPPA